MNTVEQLNPYHVWDSVIQPYLVYAAPYLWNQLPECIKNAESVDSFKRLLKTYLFKN